MTTCARPGCDNPLPPGYKRFCSEKCRDTFHQRAYTQRELAAGRMCSCGAKIFIDGPKCSKCAQRKANGHKGGPRAGAKGIISNVHKAPVCKATKDGRNHCQCQACID